MKPGVTYGEVYEASQQAIRDAGYPEFVEQAQSFRWTSIGHNIGLDLHEMPGIAKDNAAVLQPNQVICVEPFFFHDGGFPGLERPEQVRMRGPGARHGDGPRGALFGRSGEPGYLGGVRQLREPTLAFSKGSNR